MTGSTEMRMETLSPNPELWRLLSNSPGDGGSSLCVPLTQQQARGPCCAHNHTHGNDACMIFKSITNGLILQVFLQRKI